MKKISSLAKEFILDILFPKFCINCNKEGSYLCEDCFSLIDILERQYCAFCYPSKPVIDGRTCIFCRKRKSLNRFFCASSYDNFIVKKLINQFKYPPFIKELSKPLACLITAHFLNLKPFPFFLKNKKDFLIIPVPLYKKKLKQRGFNQSEEIAKELSEILKIPILNNVLIKIKQTPSQKDLNKKQRKKNIKGVFACQKSELIKRKKILLIDDIFTTGSTMEECSQTLKQAGAKEVWGIVAAKG